MELRRPCFVCKTELIFQDSIPRRAECSKCNADVHCCRNCEFYDQKAYNECHETSADPVREKDRSNFCGFFKPGAKTGPSGVKTQEDIRKAAESLFKKS